MGMLKVTSSLLAQCRQLPVSHYLETSYTTTTWPYIPRIGDMWEQAYGGYWRKAPWGLGVLQSDAPQLQKPEERSGVIPVRTLLLC